MTPAARVQTAIELLDTILTGAPAERTLTNWARSSRFAGSKDRAAVRDHVFDVLRRKNSCAMAGGGEDGRALMIGLLRQQDIDPSEIFTGTTYAPSELTAEEAVAPAQQEAIDLPDWIVPELQSALGDDFTEIEQAMRGRAPVILRCNLRKNTTAEAIKALAEEDIIAQPHPASATALHVTQGERRIKNSEAYKTGLVELQDASSQAAIDMLPLDQTKTVLDYCAGGGGKLLAMAGLSTAEFFAHDAIESRLKDLPTRASRAGVTATQVSTNGLPNHAPFDLVFCDVPCSGSGTWRRDAGAKWLFTSNDLDELTSLQQEIITKSAHLVAPQGYLAYATCSFLTQENEDQIAAFQSAHPDWTLKYQKRLSPLDGCDGFFTALFQAP